MLQAATVQGVDWAPLATFVVGCIAFGGVVLGVAQKWRSDRREHWWKRTQWALEQLEKGPEARTLGLIVLERQLDSRLANEEDFRMANDIADIVLAGEAQVV